VLRRPGALSGKRRARGIPQGGRCGGGGGGGGDFARRLRSSRTEEAAVIAMRIRAGWKARGLAKAHTDIFCRPTRLRERHSSRDGVASGALPARARSWDTHCLPTFAAEKRGRSGEQLSKLSRRATAKKLRRLRFSGGNEHAAPRRPTLRASLSSRAKEVYSTYRTRDERVADSGLLAERIEM